MSRARRSTHQHGFSLVELMIVLGVLGILAGLFMQNARAAITESNTTACEKNRQLIVDAAQLFHAREGRYPESVAELLTAGYATERADCTENGDFVFEVTDEQAPEAYCSVVCSHHGGMTRIVRDRGAAVAANADAEDADGGEPPDDEVAPDAKEDIWALDGVAAGELWDAFKKRRERNDAAEQARQKAWQQARKAARREELARRDAWRKAANKAAREEQATRRAWREAREEAQRRESQRERAFQQGLKKLDAAARAELWTAEKARRQQWAAERSRGEATEMARRKAWSASQQAAETTEKARQAAWRTERQAEAGREKERVAAYRKARSEAAERARTGA